MPAGLRLPSTFTKAGYLLQAGDLSPVSYVYTDTAEQCDSACRGIPQCYAWTWSINTERAGFRQCWLKGAAGWTGVETINYTSGVLARTAYACPGGNGEGVALVKMIP